MSSQGPTKTQAIRILTIRDQKVVLDSDLARIYGVGTGRFNEAVKRNVKRFPEDFSFLLNRVEFDNLISQIAISKPRRGGRTKLPCVFTEHGALMAATILNSQRAVAMSVYVIRAFVGAARSSERKRRNSERPRRDRPRTSAARQRTSRHLHETETVASPAEGSATPADRFLTRLIFGRGSLCGRDGLASQQRFAF